jgi:hypothetical protein
MSNTLTVTEVVNSVTVTPVNNTVEITTGISAGSTITAGILQLTDSVSSTSNTTAATPNAVKTAYDFANSQVMPFLSGSYYKGMTANLGSTTAATVNTTYYIPFFVPTTTTFDRIMIRTGGAFAGTASVRMGIYNSSAGVPTTVLLDAGTVAPTALSTSYTITISQQLTPGLYFLAANSQTAATTNTYLAIGSNQGSHYTGTPYTATATMAQYYSQASVTGAFATASSPSLGTLSGAIVAFVRAA